MELQRHNWPTSVSFRHSILPSSSQAPPLPLASFYTLPAYLSLPNRQLIYRPIYLDLPGLIQKQADG